MHSVICSGLGSLECFVITECTKFGQLILGKIIKIVATRCQILKLKCSAPDPAVGAYSAPPDPLVGFKGREGGEGKGEREEKEGREEKEREGEGKGKGGKSVPLL